MPDFSFGWRKEGKIKFNSKDLSTPFAGVLLLCCYPFVNKTLHILEEEGKIIVE